MKSKETLLQELNEGLPDFDWQAGAQLYLTHHIAASSREPIEEFVLTKPLGQVTPENPIGSLTTVVSYLYNFTNSIQLLKLKRGDRVLDVACGSGWLSHWLIKLGYDARGIDIAADFIDLAKRRLVDDPYLRMTPAGLDRAFEVRDIERQPLTQEWKGTFHAAVLESCLHHFIDPITALTHIVEGLRDDGVVLILEGENQIGPIKAEYMQVMIETQTLERPYTREQLIQVLQHAGLPHFEFFGIINGYFAESDPLSIDLNRHVKNSRDVANICLAAKNEAALQRVVPHYLPYQPPIEQPTDGLGEEPAPPTSLLRNVWQWLRR